MNEKEQKELIDEILAYRRKNKNEVEILKAVLKGEVTLPFFYTNISLTQFLKFKDHLTQFGIKSILTMNRGRYDATWELEPNALLDYKIKKRTDTIMAIINS